MPNPEIHRRALLTSALAATLAVATPAASQDYTEPKSGVAFPAERDGMSLLGAGLRVKKIAFVKAKVYAVGLYVGQDALAGPLAPLRAKGPSPELYKQLVTGDFAKELVLRFTRDVGQERIQEAMREALAGAEKAPLDTFVSYFPEVKTGQECVLRWAPGGGLEAVMAGQAKPVIANRGFAERVFGLYLGETPLQDDIKADLLVRAFPPPKP
jgi:chalcone isomerase-like protein